MQYLNYYHSPIGRLTLTSDGTFLTGLWFWQPDFSEAYQKEKFTEQELPVFQKTKEWLDIYFSGREPDISLPLRFIGTEFQKEVWEILCSIPYGNTVSYGDIARQIAEKRGSKRMSAQAVGGAVGRNPISIIVPCHRVIGADGSLVGYGGGMDKKIFLLELEK